jgi:hypothetical protein
LSALRKYSQGPAQLTLWILAAVSNTFCQRAVPASRSFNDVRYNDRSGWTPWKTSASARSWPGTGATKA